MEKKTNKKRKEGKEKGKEYLLSSHMHESG